MAALSLALLNKKMKSSRAGGLLSHLEISHMSERLLGKSQQSVEHLLAPFNISPDDPLAEAHAAVARWVEEATAKQAELRKYQEFDLKTLGSFQALLDCTPEVGVKYVHAAVLQTLYWEQ